MDAVLIVALYVLAWSVEWCRPSLQSTGSGVPAKEAAGHGIRDSHRWKVRADSLVIIVFYSREVYSNGL